MKKVSETNSFMFTSRKQELLLMVLFWFDTITTARLTIVYSDYVSLHCDSFVNLSKKTALPSKSHFSHERYDEFP